MAVIEKIRKRTGLLILIVGLALALFLVSDALSNNANLFRSNDTTVGVVAGEKIEYNEFAQRVSALEEAAQAQGRMMDAQTQSLIREQVWNEYFQELVVDEQYEELGLKVSAEELYFVVTNPKDFPQIRDAEGFKNKSTGQFDKNLVIQYLQSIETEPSGQSKKQWVQFEKESIVPQVLQKKYNVMVAKSTYITSLEIEDDFVTNNNAYEAQVAGFNFNSIVDSTIDVSEDEMRAYLKSHKEDYQQEASRKIEYVLFPVKPSKADTASLRKWAEKTVIDFRNSTDDTVFVENKGVNNRYDTTFRTRDKLVTEIQDDIYDAEVDSVLGPYFDGTNFNVYKLTGTSEDSLATFKISQILIKPDGRTKEDSLYAVTRANKILSAIRGGEDFEALAQDSSEDYRSSSQGGNMGWIRENGGRVPKNVESQALNTAAGNYFVTRTAQGAHLVKVTGAKSYKTVNVQVVSAPVEASGETEELVYEAAYKLASSARTAEAFADSAENMGYIKRVSPDLKEGDASLPSIENARNIIRWAFKDETTVGSVSEAVQIGDQYVVALLVDIKEKGTAKLEDVRDQLENDTRIQKKAEMLKKRILEAMKGNESTDLQQLALDMNTVMNNAPNVMFNNPNIPFVGNDPLLVGAITGAKEETINGPVRTEQGVYIFKVLSTTKPEMPKELDAERQRIAKTKTANAQGKAFQAIKEAAGLEDYRYKFF